MSKGLPLRFPLHCTPVLLIYTTLHWFTVHRKPELFGITSNSMVLHGVLRCLTTSRRKVLNYSARIGPSTRLEAQLNCCIICINNNNKGKAMAALCLHETYWIVSSSSVHKQINFHSASFCNYSLVNLPVPRHRPAVRHYIYCLIARAHR